MLVVLVVKIIGFKGFFLKSRLLVSGHITGVWCENSFSFGLKQVWLQGTSTSIKNNVPRSYTHVMGVMLVWFPTSLSVILRRIHCILLLIIANNEGYGPIWSRGLLLLDLRRFFHVNHLSQFATDLLLFLFSASVLY